MTSKKTPQLFEVLLTADEAYPALEQQFMDARENIIAGFRVFDPFTQLRSPMAQRVGQTWFDLIVDTLNRGVEITLILTDFDPVVRLDTHRYAWKCARGLIAAGEASDNPSLLTLRVSMHPARVGLLPRLALWPRLNKEIKSGLQNLDPKQIDDVSDLVTIAPGLQSLTRWRGSDLVPAKTPPTLVPATHHQKLAVFDRMRLYLGGLDVNDRRFDTLAHDRAADETWHDTQILIDGPVAKEAAAHLLEFEAVTAGAKPSDFKHLLRTISAKRRIALPYLSPKPVVSTLANAHHEQIARADHLIYLETQFFRDQSLARQLAHRANENPDLSLILILPAAPEDAAFNDAPSSDVAYGEYQQLKSIEIIKDAFGDRAFIGSPAQPRTTDRTGRATHYDAPIIYLHAKVSVFDDRCAIVSSANLNGRSLSWDTETGVLIQDPGQVTHLRYRCFDHWFTGSKDDRMYNLKTAQKAWLAWATDNARRAPDRRDGFILPYDATPGADLAFPLPGVPAEMV